MWLFSVWYSTCWQRDMSDWDGIYRCWLYRRY